MPICLSYNSGKIWVRKNENCKYTLTKYKKEKF